MVRPKQGLPTSFPRALLGKGGLLGTCWFSGGPRTPQPGPAWRVIDGGVRE